jgi:adenylate cyclase
MKKITKSALILIIIVVAIVIQQLINLSPLQRQVELLTHDLRAKAAVDNGLFGNKFMHADKNIVIVAADDTSAKEIANHPELGISSWPWPRNTWADVVDFIEEGHPKAVIFDVVFNGLNDNSWNDRIFAQALRKYDNIVLGITLNDPKILVDKGGQPTNCEFNPTEKSLNVSVDDKKLDDSITYYSHSPVHNLYTNHNRMGVLNKVAGSDSVIRKSQPIFKLVKNGETYYMPSLAFAGFLKYMGEDGQIVIKDQKLYYKNRVIPLSEDYTRFGSYVTTNKGTSEISWHGYGNDYDFIHISKILLSTRNRREINPNTFKDKIVFIGHAEAGTDFHATAVNENYSGIEANATALDNFINDTNPQNHKARKFVRQTKWYQNLFIVVVCCLALVGIGIVSKNAMIGLLSNALFIFLYIVSCFYAFVNPEIRLWIPMAAPLYYMLVTSTTVFTFKLQDEISKWFAVTNTFGKFVSPNVLATLLKNQDDLVLKSTRKKITVMFCDVKNFTTISEKSDPEQLLNNLNELFNIIVNTIFENNGTVDKFIGDCIMAYWGDPIASDDDAYMAVKTALEIKKRVNELKITNAKENKIIFDVKIGINTGDALLGLAGSEKIMSYTAMGDAVNTASRLESNCSKLEKDILMSKATFDATSGNIIALEAGTINVKGKEEAIVIYEPIGLSKDFDKTEHSEIKSEND